MLCVGSGAKGASVQHGEEISRPTASSGTSHPVFERRLLVSSKAKILRRPLAIANSVP